MSRLIEVLKFYGCDEPNPDRVTGKIRCPAPDHDERRASCSYDLERELLNCLGGETVVMTWDGPREISALAGTSPRLLTTKGWVDAPVREFGVQELWEIELSRNGRRKTIRATAGHRWFIASGERTTSELRKGHRLRAVRNAGGGNPKPSPWGVAHGVTFGDGSYGNTGSNVSLWGEKDAPLAAFFPLSPSCVVTTPNGVKGRNFWGLPRAFKSLPDLDESTGYLYGWLAGYFAADGCVAECGTPMLSSAKVENLEFARLVAMRCGVTTHEIRSALRVGKGTEATPLYQLTFSRSSLTEGFFLIEEHRRRWLAGNDVNERLGWTVLSTKPTGVFEPVYCATVDGIGNFALEGNILTGNCFACGFQGDAVNLIMAKEGIDAQAAVRRREEIAGGGDRPLRGQDERRSSPVSGRAWRGPVYRNRVQARKRHFD